MSLKLIDVEQEEIKEYVHDGALNGDGAIIFSKLQDLAGLCLETENKKPEVRVFRFAITDGDEKGKSAMFKRTKKVVIYFNKIRNGVVKAHCRMRGNNMCVVSVVNKNILDNKEYHHDFGNGNKVFHFGKFYKHY